MDGALIVSSRFQGPTAFNIDWGLAISGKICQPFEIYLESFQSTWVLMIYSPTDNFKVLCIMWRTLYNMSTF